MRNYTPLVKSLNLIGPNLNAHVDIKGRVCASADLRGDTVGVEVWTAQMSDMLDRLMDHHNLELDSYGVFMSEVAGFKKAKMWVRWKSIQQ